MGSDPNFSSLDHLVVAARSLEEGDAWVRERLGVGTLPGGKHATMGTHNRVLRLDGERYLEVIAIDPDAPPPKRPRWFELDAPEMKERLAAGPALVHWVEATQDIDTLLKHAAPGHWRIESFSRGPYRWRMLLPADGRMPWLGKVPTYIQWDGPHPTENMPRSGWAFISLQVREEGLQAHFAGPAGTRTLP